MSNPIYRQKLLGLFALVLLSLAMADDPPAEGARHVRDAESAAAPARREAARTELQRELVAWWTAEQRTVPAVQQLRWH